MSLLADVLRVLEAPGLQFIDSRYSSVDTGETCWVCSSRFLPGERTSYLPSLGIDVHARCAAAVLHGDPLPEPPDEHHDTAA